MTGTDVPPRWIDYLPVRDLRPADENPKNHDLPTLRASIARFGLVDAAFEYLDHLRGYRNRDTYLGRCILRPEPLKARAVEIAKEVCTA